VTDLGDALFRCNRANEALAQFEMALKIDPNYRPARAKYEQLHARIASQAPATP
jgi:hypothetical protein